MSHEWANAVVLLLMAIVTQLWPLGNERTSILKPLMAIISAVLAFVAILYISKMGF